MPPDVSVIVGTYNCSQFLPGLWECLEAQTYRNFEIVVVDDASTDGETLNALEAMGSRIRLIRRTANSGTCELPRYQGVQAARTPYCAFLDADDRWDPAFLDRCIAHLQQHPDHALVHTSVRLIDGEDRLGHIRHEEAMPTGDALSLALLHHCYITISAVLVQRDIWLDTLPEQTITDFGMDQDFFLRISKQHPIGFIPDVLAFYRRSEASVSVKKWRRRPRNIITLKRIQKRGDWKGLVSAADMRHILGEACLENAHYWQNRHDPARAFYFAAQGLNHHPANGSLWRIAFRSLLNRMRP